MLRPYERGVYYYETDKMGIMHHSNYIRIFEETRIFFLEQGGLPFPEIEKRGILMPVVSVECSYHNPLRFGDRFTVDLKITKFSGVRLFVPDKTMQEVNIEKVYCRYFHKHSFSTYLDKKAAVCLVDGGQKSSQRSKGI